MFTPIGKNIIVDLNTIQKQNVTDSGINLGESLDVLAKTVSSGVIVSVGEEVTVLAVGDTVLFEIHAGNEFEISGETYVSVQQVSVIGYERPDSSTQPINEEK